MQDIARGCGFQTRQLLDERATSDAIISSIESAAERLYPGDLFWISYSGHGSQVPDLSEPDQRSETWVLWDRQLIDDELYALWGRFRAGVRILLISDSCHSGTVARQIALLNAAAVAAFRDTEMIAVRSAMVPSSTAVTSLVREAARTFLPTAGASRSVDLVEQPRLLNEALGYQDAAQRATLYRSQLARSINASAPQCSVLLLSGCQDNQTSSDGRPDPSGHQNGAFTNALRNVWQSARDYADLHDRILQQMPPTQTPNRYWATERDAAFEAQRPFTI
jgi:hypothetical protein